MYLNVNAFEVLEKRRVDHCLLSMEGLAEGQAGARLACGEVRSSNAMAVKIYQKLLGFLFSLDKRWSCFWVG